MNCINLRIKQKNYRRYLYCNIMKKEIQYSDCSNCPYKRYKQYNTIKKESSVHRKNENNRFSLFTKDLNHCIICGKAPVNKHEIFYGKNRQNSIKYGLVIPLCIEEHHNTYKQIGIHFDKHLCDYWHNRGKEKFIETYPELDFVSIFGQTYN